MHFAKALFVSLTTVTGAHAAIEFNAFVQHLAEVQNNFFSFQSKAQTIVDMKSGYKAMNAVQNFFDQAEQGAEYVATQIVGSVYSIAQQNVLCNQMGTVMTVEDAALKLFALKAPSVNGASPALYQTYQDSISALEDAESDMYKALYQYLPACKGTLQKRFAATLKGMDAAIASWDLPPKGEMEARDEGEGGDVHLKRLVKRELEDFGTEEI